MGVQCLSDGYFYNEEDYISSIGCLENQDTQLYESISAMPDCKAMSLVVGSDFSELGTIKTLALCFNFLEQQLKYVAYTAYPSKIKIIEHVIDELKF